MQTVALIDYGSGNLRSAQKALMAAAAVSREATTVLTTGQAEEIAGADRIVLPGVGAFAACMAALASRPGLIEALDNAVRQRGAPFLGICVGMQLMASRGLEFGATPGLDWIAGEVRRLETGDDRLKIPHMGWNDFEADPKGPLFDGLSMTSDMYFTHSFAFFPKEDEDVAASTRHGGAFPAAVTRANLAGVQFHPEKSQAAGARLLSNFLAWRP